jgi:hypothetical protein
MVGSGRHEATVPFTYFERKVVQRGLPSRLVTAIVICFGVSLVRCGGALLDN